MRAAALASLLFLSGCSYYELPFWTEQDPPTDRRVRSVEGAPCGAIATVRVKNMHDVRDNPDLEADAVYEVGTDGGVQAEWLIPASSQPLAIANDKLLVEGYWIGRDGSIALAGQTRLPEPKPRPEYPIPAKLQNSGYAVCMAFTDLESGTMRQLAYEAPCT